MSKPSIGFRQPAAGLASIVVDSCMIPREVCALAKQRAERATGIRSDRMLISATHTHSAPSVMDYNLDKERQPHTGGK